MADQDRRTRRSPARGRMRPGCARSRPRRRPWRRAIGWRSPTPSSCCARSCARSGCSSSCSSPSWSCWRAASNRPSSPSAAPASSSRRRPRARREAAEAASAAAPGRSRRWHAAAQAAANLERLSRNYEQARRFARLVSTPRRPDGQQRYVIVTGGGPGIMEAANRGAAEAGAISIGHNIVLPHEQAPNPWITPELCFQFHYFALRKMHLMTAPRRWWCSRAASARWTSCSRPCA